MRKLNAVLGAILLSLSLAHTSLAQETNKNAEFAQVQKIYQEQLVKIEEMYSAKPKAILEEYAKELDVLEQAVIRMGNLKSVVAVRKEKEEFKVANAITDTTDKTPVELKLLKDKYKRMISILPAEKNKDIERLTTLYIGRLESLQVALTRATQIDSALTVSREIENVKKQNTAKVAKVEESQRQLSTPPESKAATTDGKKDVSPLPSDSNGLTKEDLEYQNKFDAELKRTHPGKDIKYKLYRDHSKHLSLALGTALTLYKNEQPAREFSDLSPIKKIRDLIVLILGDTKVTDLTPLQEVSSLQYLDLLRTKISDLSPLKGLSLKYLNIWGTTVTNIVPLQGMNLRCLNAERTEIRDISPLHGMPLTELYLSGTQINDLSPLKGMSLKTLNINGTNVRDISPLKGLPIKFLYLSQTPVTDLTPLEGMWLEELSFDHAKITNGMEVVRNMKTIKKIGVEGYVQNLMSPEDFWKKYDPDGKYLKKEESEPSKLPLGATKPLTKEDLECQKAFEVELKRTHPGKEIKFLLYRDSSNGLSLEIGRTHDGLRCQSPEFSDLSAVRLIPNLDFLNIMRTQVTDISPLRGMSIRALSISDSYVTDLRPIEGMKLNVLSAGRIKIRDISPLRGMPLSTLHLNSTLVDDLTPLAGMKLVLLSITDTQVRDLSALRGMPLNGLAMERTLVTDLSTLDGMRLKCISLDPSRITKGLEVVRNMETITKIGTHYLIHMSPEEFWKKYDPDGKYLKK